MDEKKEEQTIFRHPITKNMELLSCREYRLTQRKGKMPLAEVAESRPIVILLAWFRAKPRHVDKFVRLYFTKGFDVLKISLEVWQALWPESGSHVVATDILEFLLEHERFDKILVHGFSVGAYLWSEALVKMEEREERYQPIMDRMRGQIIDSPPACPPAFQRGFAAAFFPDNPVLCLMFQYLLTGFIYVFYNKLTIHLFRSYKTAHYPPIKIPSLMFFSKDDPISPFDMNMGVIEAWKSKGLQTYVRYWDQSPHVGHFVRHQQEYLDHFNTLLDAAGLNNLSTRQVSAGAN